MKEKIELTRDDRIKKEKARLTRIFKDIPKDKKALILKLIENASFMAITLEDLQEQINVDGAVFASTNGNGFDVVIEHPAQKSYNTMINRFNSTIKQLADMLPSEKGSDIQQAGSNLAAFIAKGKGSGSS